jgi:hypothetical protein
VQVQKRMKRRQGETYAASLEDPELGVDPTDDLALERHLVARQRTAAGHAVDAALLVGKAADPERVRRLVGPGAGEGRVKRFGYVADDGVEGERVGRLEQGHEPQPMDRRRGRRGGLGVAIGRRGRTGRWKKERLWPISKQTKDGGSVAD